MARIKDVIITSSTTHNVLASGTKMKGNISAEEDFRIDGVLDGNMNCKGKVIIGTNGIVTGEIECANIELLGEIRGNILCANTVILRASCILTGEVKTKSIEIEPGAKFTGNCSMV